MEEHMDALKEIYKERERYLLNIDGLLEEMHSITGSEAIADNTGYNAGIICCRTLVDMNKARGAEVRAGE